MILMVYFSYQLVRGFTSIVALNGSADSVVGVADPMNIYVSTTLAYDLALLVFSSFDRFSSIFSTVTPFSFKFDFLHG